MPTPFGGTIAARRPAGVPPASGGGAAASETPEAFPAGLVFNRDAANALSYPGTGQLFKNLLAEPADGEAQGVYDMYLGTTSASQSSDPTFTGPAGGKTSSTYWAFNGSQQMVGRGTLPALLAEAALSTPTKELTYLCAVHTPTLSAESSMFATERNTGTNSGITFDLTTARLPRFRLWSDAASNSDKTGATALTVDSWNIVGFSFKGSGVAGSFIYLNGAYNQVSGADTFTATNGTCVNSANRARFGYADNARYIASGSRLGRDLAANVAWSKAQMDAAFDLMRGRYGL